MPPVNRSYIQTLLAKEVLAEIPDQVTLYMKTNGIKPLEPNLNRRSAFQDYAPSLMDT